MRVKFVIIDYGGSNLRSVARAFSQVVDDDHEVVVSSDPATIGAADRVIFPGQGAVGDCMRGLDALGLTAVIKECLATRPFLGICLGLQCLLSYSDEDAGVDCLNIIPGNVARFTRDQLPIDQRRNFKIPHMGWNQVHWRRTHALTANIDSGSRFYFVHSYYVVPDDPAVIAAETDYIAPFVAAVAFGNVFATQFHPEKSQRAGLQLLQNFARWPGGDH